MKTSVLVIVLALLAVAPLAAMPQAQPGTSASAAPVIKDPAEYNAYMGPSVKKIQPRRSAAWKPSWFSFPIAW